MLPAFFFFPLGFQADLCPSLKTNAVSDPELRTTGNREAGGDKTHDILEKCLIRDILDQKHSIKGWLDLLDSNPQATNRHKDESQTDLTTPSAGMDITVDQENSEVEQLSSKEEEPGPC